METVIIPSSCKKAIPGNDFHQWSKAELQIRVGIGHDLLQELRVAAGLHSYYLRRQKHSRGRVQMERVAKSQDSASKNKSTIISKYIKNWESISQILRNDNSLTDQSPTLLKGLQQLNASEDVKFFEEWGTQTGSYAGYSELNVSWIWRVAMEGQPSALIVKESEIKELTNSWESEGELFLKSIQYSIQSFNTARRLQWLYFFSRNERWKEEVILVAEEIRRVGAWYRHEIEKAEHSAKNTEELGDSWVCRGSKSMLNKRVLRMRTEYNLLPSMAKSEKARTYEDILRLFSESW
jgi:hypothetical protein